MSTSYFLPDGFVYNVPGDLPRQPATGTTADLTKLNTEHLSWAKKETHTDDPASYLPLARLSELADEGRIGSVSERFYCLPTQFSQRTTTDHDAPQVLEWMQEDDVDVALLVPL